MQEYLLAAWADMAVWVWDRVWDRKEMMDTVA
jgi:hypothetical protein